MITLYVPLASPQPYPVHQPYPLLHKAHPYTSTTPHTSPTPYYTSPTPYLHQPHPLLHQPHPLPTPLLQDVLLPHHTQQSLLELHCGVVPSGLGRKEVALLVHLHTRASIPACWSLTANSLLTGITHLLLLLAREPQDMLACIIGILQQLVY